MTLPSFGQPISRSNPVDITDLGSIVIVGPIAGQILIFDGVDWRNRVLSGDVTISPTGVTGISPAVIVNADISPTAEIDVSKLADGTSRQVLQTDAAGTGVEWTNDVDLPGTLDVTGVATFDSLISAVGGQIAFPAVAVPSADPNTLDDYEEGTWTPVLTFATPGDLSVAYAIRVGTYTKIGRLVRINVYIVTSTFTHTTASGNVQVTGLPFTSANIASSWNFGGGEWQGITKATFTDLACEVRENISRFNVQMSGSGQGSSYVIPADMPSAGTVLFRVSVAYFA